MDASYQTATFGLDEPEFMWLTGRTIKFLASELHEAVRNDVDGNELVDGQLYLLDKEGIHPVED